MVTSEPGITNAVSEKPDSYPDPYKYVFTRDTGGMRVAQPNPAVSSSPAAESKIRRSIDHFDSKISRIEKYIGKVLHL